MPIYFAGSVDYSANKFYYANSNLITFSVIFVTITLICKTIGKRTNALHRRKRPVSNHRGQTRKKQMEKQSTGVQSLEVGLHILDVLVAATEPLMLKEIANLSAMHPAKVHRYLVSLVNCRYAKQHPDGRYGLGDQALNMGLLATRRSDALQLVQESLWRLNQQVGESLQVTRWTALGPLIVQFLDHGYGISVSAKVGAVMPILRSATGRLYASLLPETMIEPVLQQEYASDFAEVWQAFASQRRQLQTQAWCAVEGELVAGINAIAAPVWDANHDVVFVITCLGRAEHMDVREGSLQVKAVLAAAGAMSQQLGYQ